MGAHKRDGAALVDRAALVQSERSRTIGAPIQALPPGLWVVGFVFFEFVTQLLLIVPGLGSARVVFRVAGFTGSLAMLVLLPPRGRPLRPISHWVGAVLLILGLEMLNPQAGGVIPATAQFMLNLSILAPVFWVPRTAVTVRTFRSLVLCFWGFYSLSACVGVLQAYFPGHFQPALSSILAAQGKWKAVALQITLASGEHIFRPMGLSDVPGAAAFAALYAIVLGTGILLLPKPPFPWARLAAVASMLAGMICLYLCQVRSLLVMTGICVIVMIAVTAISGKFSRAVGLLTAAAAVIPISFVAAFALGGKLVTKRLSTLVQADAGTVYCSNRGHFLDQTINEYLPRFPLGAGLGRWGMVCKYFSNLDDYLYVEIQWTGWLFDGGLPLILVYSGAILAATWLCFRMVRKFAGTDGNLDIWASVVVAYNVGALALCFNYPVFIGTTGLEFWVLNAALICAGQNAEREGSPRKVLS